jgi:hypothetical protein
LRNEVLSFDHACGERKALFEEGGSLADMNFGTLATYGWVARQVETSRRLEVLSFQHHWNFAALSSREQKRWLALAGRKR